MNILFIHQNFPGQYLHLAQYLRTVEGHTIIGIGETVNIQRRGTIAGMTTLGYPTPEGAGAGTHHYLRSTEAAIRRGQSVIRVLLDLRAKGFVPDVISVHPGWGEGLFVRDVFPHTPILMFCEYYFHANAADLTFDPEFNYSLDWGFSVRIRNSAQLISLATANACLSPTEWQTSRYPSLLRDRIHTIHDGVDTAYMHPNASAKLVIQPTTIPGESRVVSPMPPPQETAEVPPIPDATLPQPLGEPFTFAPGDKVITYVARNLEPYRGVHVFLRALPKLQERHPDAHILIIGADGTSYSPALPPNETYKKRYMAEMEGKLDLSHIHFLGRVSYAALRELFRISAAHVYLTYPFVLSWSMLESMACESLLVASRTAPVEEVITDGKNGILVDFFDGDALVDALSEALSSPEKFRAIRKEARQTILQRYQVQDCLRQQIELLYSLARGEYPLLD